jgi:hypothetical protein
MVCERPSNGLSGYLPVEGDYGGDLREMFLRKVDHNLLKFHTLRVAGNLSVNASAGVVEAAFGAVVASNAVARSFAAGSWVQPIICF